jgi:hypothetical protein
MKCFDLRVMLEILINFDLLIIGKYLILQTHLLQHQKVLIIINIGDDLMEIFLEIILK